MRKVKEILRQKLVLERSHRVIARSLGISSGAVSETVSRAKKADLVEWSDIETIEEAELEKRLYGPRIKSREHRPLPDPAVMDIELRRKGVTLQLLHVEYLEKHSNGYRYTQFCEHYKQWKKRQGPTMRQVHRAGEKMFVDYSGKKLDLVDRITGEVSEVELFVSVLGASNMTYVEATRTQGSRDWIRSHENAFRYYGGVPNAVVPDQLKSGVSKACRYEPEVQRTYEEMLMHYGTAALPARPKKPRDKGKVEQGVQFAQRWIVARLRNETFHSLSELNGRIRELVDDLNDRRMRRYGVSRRELFESIERSALSALPEGRFEYGEWKYAKLSIDYHFVLDGHYYSAPFQLVGEKLEIRASAKTIEVFLRGRRITSHARDLRRGHHTTKREHMPASHRAHAEWTPQRMVRWAEKVGPNTAQLVKEILEDRPHPEQGYRSCLGLMRLAKQYGNARTETACNRALAVRARSYKHVAAILKNGLDRLPSSRAANTNVVSHENVRGAGYYQQGDNDAE